MLPCKHGLVEERLTAMKYSRVRPPIWLFLPFTALFDIFLLYWSFKSFISQSFLVGPSQGYCQVVQNRILFPFLHDTLSLLRTCYIVFYWFSYLLCTCHHSNLFNTAGHFRIRRAALIINCSIKDTVRAISGPFTVYGYLVSWICCYICSEYINYQHWVCQS